MSRPMINATLFNVDTEDDEYLELRQEMVDELVADELDQPIHSLKAMLQDHVLNMFTDLDDDTLQDMYNNLMEAKKE